MSRSSRFILSLCIVAAVAVILAPTAEARQRSAGDNTPVVIKEARQRSLPTNTPIVIRENRQRALVTNTPIVIRENRQRAQYTNRPIVIGENSARLGLRNIVLRTLRWRWLVGD